MRCWMLLLGLLGPMGAASAQDSSADVETGEIIESRGQVASEKTIFKLDANGQWRPVPLAPDAFDKRPPGGSQPTAEAPSVPDYYFSKLTLEGDVIDASVMMTAEVTIKVITPDRWLKVPLRFDQASLREHYHAGAGEAAPVLDGKQNEGISWMLRGAGEHRLRLQFRLPLRKTPEGEQLQLQLPKLGIITGKLELRVPSPSATFRDVEGVRLLGVRNPDDDAATPEDESQSTIASAELVGERLDLRWNVILQRAETIIQEPTEITLRLTEDVFELTAHQKVQFREGLRKALRVRLPSTDFELAPQGVRVSDPSGTDLLVTPSAPDEQSWVTIPMDGVVGNLVELDWRFTRPPPETSSEIAIDGFEVADAPRHTGTVMVEAPADFSVSRIENGDAGVKRIDVNERSASLAYAFSGGQFRLRLRVEPVEPSLSVTPYYFLLVSRDRIEMEAAFEINVDGGSFRNVPIQLHEQEGTSWLVEASSLTPGDLVPKDADDEQDSARKWTLQLPDAVDRRTVVGLSAAYFFGLYESQDTTSVSLPMVTDARTFPGWLVVSTADNVEVLTRARAGTTLTRQDGSALSGGGVILPEWIKTQPQTVYRVATKDPQSAPALETDVTVRPQQTATSTVVELSLLDQAVHVSQRITYNVEYGRVSRIRLQIPPRLAALAPEGFRDDALWFSLDGVTPLEEEWSERDVSLDLPSPRLGEFEVVVGDYSIGRKPTAGDEAIAVPIIRSLDQPYEKVRLSVPDRKAMAVTVADEQWTRLATVIEGLQWITDQPVEEVALTLNRSLEQSPLRLTIAAALLQTTADEAGRTSTTATYLIDHPARQLVVQLPENAENPRFVWNESALADTAAVEEPDFPNQFRLSLPTDPVEEAPRQSRLRIQYACPPSEAGWSQSHKVDFPVFPDGVWIEETWWELTLPQSLHLFVSPGTMTPQFQWRRDLISWSRKSTFRFEQAKSDILQEPFLEPSTSDASGNVYAFKSFGSPTLVQYRSLSKSVIVFLGAGLTLSISFLVVKVPAARHPSLWMFVGLVLTGASLWYLEPMLLLLQPAAYGLVLPLCAALLEYATESGRRPRRPQTSEWSGWESAGDGGSVHTPNGGAEPQLVTTHVRSGGVSDSGSRP